MTFVPLPDAWRQLESRIEDGTGTLTLDGVPVLVRGLRRDVDGVVRGECQHEGDGWIERELGA